MSRDFVASVCVEWTKPVLPVLRSSLTVKSLSFREFKAQFECRFLSAFSKVESVLISSVWNGSLEMLCREEIIVKMVRKNHVIF